MNILDKITDKRSNDYLDKLIFEKGLRIKSLEINKRSNLLLLILNNDINIQFALTEFPFFSKTTHLDLNNWELSGNGIGVHWKDLDQDFSLKGFIMKFGKEKFLEVIK